MIADQPPAPTPPLRVAIMTGMSGAGRSTAARALEDLGWFVVENIPPMLIGRLLSKIESTPSTRKIAIVVDVRGGDFFSETVQAVSDLRQSPVDVTMVFLEAGDHVLVRRFEGNRRPHPLQGSGRITDGLARERELVAGLRGMADLVLDTSAMNERELRRRIEAAFPDEETVQLRATVMSFGFKYGIPIRRGHGA